MHIILIDIDSLRPDHLGCYGYDAPTSPNIDAFAADAVRFERAYVANSPCMPSRAGLISGRYGVNNGVVTHGPRGQLLASPHTTDELDGPREDWFTLPEVFFEEHVTTTAISSFPRHPATWFYHVWDTFVQPREPAESAQGNAEYFQTPRAGVVADQAIEVIEWTDEESSFLYVQLWDPHTPYNRTEEEVDRFRKETPLPDYPTKDDIDDHQEWDAYLSASEMPHRVRAGSERSVTDREGLRELLALYDAEIRYADRHLGRIFERLRDVDRYEDSLIIVTADHGEEFGEHGLYGCHWSVYEGTQRVPLLIKPPATHEISSGVRDHLVTNVDLPKTILDYAELSAPASWQGSSLRPVVETGDADGRDFVVLEHGLVTAQRAVRTDRWKLVRTFHPGMWESELPASQLFDLGADPWEQTNLADDHPDLVADLREKAHDWVDQHIGPAPDPIREVARGEPELYKGAKTFYEGV